MESYSKIKIIIHLYVFVQGLIFNETLQWLYITDFLLYIRILASVEYLILFESKTASNYKPVSLEKRIKCFEFNVVHYLYFLTSWILFFNSIKRTTIIIFEILYICIFNTTRMLFSYCIRVDWLIDLYLRDVRVWTLFIIHPQRFYFQLE